MSFTQEMKQKIGGLERFRGLDRRKFDWIGFVVLISATVIVAFFVQDKLTDFVEENELRRLELDYTTDDTLYRYNVNKGISTPEKTYEEARQALLNNDLEGVLATIHPDYLWKYEDGLRQANKDGKLHEAAERMTPLKEKVYDDEESSIVYKTELIPGNDSSNLFEGYRETVEFLRDKKGKWKISSI